MQGVQGVVSCVVAWYLGIPFDKSWILGVEISKGLSCRRYKLEAIKVKESTCVGVVGYLAEPLISHGF